VKPPPFRYERPASLDEALAILGDGGQDARILAGGQSLVPMLNMRLAAPEVVVDVNRLPGLAGIGRDGDQLVVGALTRQRVLERSPETAVCPLLAQCLPLVGHTATRSRGTVGGSIAHADPAAELPLVLLASGGEVEVAGPAGRRRVPATELFAGFLSTTLGPGEMIVACRFGSAAGDGQGSGFAEAALRYGDFAYAAAAATVTMAAGRVTGARVAVGAAADRPLLLEDAAAVLRDTRGDAPARQEAAAAARRAVEPSGSLHAPADYQRHMTGVMVARALATAVDQATSSRGGE
jgi:CO/xanthine dehydrogenase FAD-binding subunit